MSIEVDVRALTQIADGALLALALGYGAGHFIGRFAAASSALGRIRRAPSLSVSEVCSSLEGSDSSDDRLVVVRGVVQAKSTVGGNWKDLLSDHLLVSEGSGERGVVLQQSQMCMYGEWKGFFGYAHLFRGVSDQLHLLKVACMLRRLFERSLRVQDSTSLRMVPFALVEGGRQPQSDYLVVNMDESRHLLPLVTAYRRLQPTSDSPWTFLGVLFGHEYPVLGVVMHVFLKFALLDTERILPLGKDITAVGICSLKNGIAEIKSCKDLPYFLSHMTKDQMVGDLAFKTKLWLWSGVVLGAFSVGIFCYAAVRNWNRWKEQQQRRQRQRLTQLLNHLASDEFDPQIPAQEDVPDSELCIICLTRRRRTAFIPCGHLIFCQLCAIRFELDSTLCPICRQTIHSSVAVHDS